jgi:23S rRNA pseudoU1915 N3-methylase RlmH
MRLRLILLGKTRRPELRTLFDDYVKRISHSTSIEVNEVRDAEAAIKRLDADRAATALLLDAGGKPQDSESLARWLAERRDHGTREIILICGDADGFPSAQQTRHPKTFP